MVLSGQGMVSADAAMALLVVGGLALLEWVRLVPELEIEAPREVVLEHGVWFRDHLVPRAVTLRRRSGLGPDPVLDLELVEVELDRDLLRLEGWLDQRRRAA